MDSATPDSAASSLEEQLTKKVVGQTDAVKRLIPCIQMFQAGLSPAGRPAGVFLLLGTTGTGKTRTVEALAEILHGTSRKVVRVDCGEFQLDHEIAKLIGSPPGYIGHRETQPILNKDRLMEATSEQSNLALVLFDEIEKAAPSLARLLLGILDKGILRLGDNTEVNFEQSLVFFTSNLGAREMTKEMQPGLGFRSGPPDRSDLIQRLEGVAIAAVRKMYSPEFVNRIDAVITYQPLDEESCDEIFDLQLQELQNHLNTRLGNESFTVSISADSRKFLLAKGFSVEYGARELKRIIYRYLTQPLATLVLEGKIDPGTTVQVDVKDDATELRFTPLQIPGKTPSIPTMLIVDDNKDFLRLLSLQLGEGEKWRIITAQSMAEVEQAVSGQKIDFALLDLLLPDGNGIRLGQQLKQQFPNLRLIIMTGGVMTLEDDQILQEGGFEFLIKPFLARDILKLIEKQYSAGVADARGGPAGS
jgi:DNA-binding NtrC family response regulator